MGGGLRVASDAVVTRRRSGDLADLSVYLRAFGVALIVVGTIPWAVGGLLIVSWLLSGDAIVAGLGQAIVIVAGLIVEGLIPLAGWMVICVSRLISSERTVEQEVRLDKLLDGLNAIGWFWFVLGLLSTVVTIVGTIFGVVIAFVVVSRRAARKDELLWVLAIAAQKNMPLAPAVAAFAAECRGRYRRRVRQLADMLAGGATLPDALDSLPDVVPESTRVAARIGWEAGALGKALRQEAALRTLQRPVWHAFAGRLLYLFAVMLVIQSVAGFIVYFIAPKFKRIFMDFGVELPAVTQLVTDWGELAIETLALPILLIVQFVVVAVLLAMSLSGRADWTFLGRVFRRMNTSVVLRALALGVEAGQPLTAGLGTLAASYPRWGIRQRLARALELVRGGRPWHESLEHERLILPVEAAVLESAQRAGNLSWALREMADGSDRRLGYRLEVWTHVLFPLAVLGIGFVVFLLVAGYFSPLVKLIAELTG
jgi:protein transport protein HofC